MISWRRNMYALGFGLFLSMAGMNAALPFFPLFVRELGVEEPKSAHLWSGLVLAAPFFLSIFTVPLWGAMADRYGRKLLTVRAALGLAVFTLFMGFSRNVTDLFILRILQGAFAGFVAASLSLVSASAPADRSGYAIGMLQMAIATGSIVGPLFGGILADIFGVRKVMFIVAGLCFAGAGVVALFVNEPERQRSDEHFSVLSNLRLVLGSASILSVVILIGSVQFAMSFTQPIFPTFVESLGAPAGKLATITGLLAGITGLSNAIFAPIWGRRGDRVGFHRTFGIALPLVAFAIAIQGAMNNYEWLVAPRIVIGLCSAALIPSLYAVISRIVPIERSSGVIGLASSAHLLGSLLGPLACSVVAILAGERWCFVAAGCLALLTYLLLAKKLPQN